MTRLMTIMAFIFSFLFSCSQSNEFTSVSVDEFAQLIKEEDIQLLDVRTAEEYSEGHIAGSINIDVKRDDFEQRVDSLADKKKSLAVYCRSGVRSKTAATILIKNGYKIYELNKGILSWQDAGKDIIK